MTDLILSPNFTNSDDFYADLLAAFESLEDSEIHALNARLVLILANHIGDNQILRDALKAAK